MRDARDRLSDADAAHDGKYCVNFDVFVVRCHYDTTASHSSSSSCVCVVDSIQPDTAARKPYLKIPKLTLARIQEYYRNPEKEEEEE